MKNSFQTRSVVFLLLILLLGLAWMGCSTIKERHGEAGIEGQVAMTPSSQSLGRNYYFWDVFVPKELNYKPNKSFIYDTPQFRAGIIYFTKWRFDPDSLWGFDGNSLDADSLIDFFNFHMKKSNWKIVNSYRGKESFLTFSKPDRTCTIRIMEKWYGSVHVEIQVGPLAVE